MSEPNVATESASQHLERHFSIGQFLDIQVNDDSQKRFQSQLIGLKANKYLLVDQPATGKKDVLKEVLASGQKLIVRSIAERTTGKCVGFHSRVQFKLEVPDPMMFISYPSMMQVFELRKEHRILVNVPGKVLNGQGSLVQVGTVVDFSSGGCRMEFDDGDEETFQPDNQVVVSFNHPITTEKLNEKAKVCSCRKIDDVLSVGFAFLEK